MPSPVGVSASSLGLRDPAGRRRGLSGGRGGAPCGGALWGGIAGTCEDDATNVGSEISLGFSFRLAPSAGLEPLGPALLGEGRRIEPMPSGVDRPEPDRGEGIGDIGEGWPW